jgi:hypothetical protein
MACNQHLKMFAQGLVLFLPKFASARPGLISVPFTPAIQVYPLHPGMRHPKMNRQSLFELFK